MERASYSGVRWWIMGWAMASSTLLGTGVGPGAISWYFFIAGSLLALLRAQLASAALRKAMYAVPIGRAHRPTVAEPRGAAQFRAFRRAARTCVSRERD